MLLFCVCWDFSYFSGDSGIFGGKFVDSTLIGKPIEIS